MSESKDLAVQTQLETFEAALETVGDAIPRTKALLEESEAMLGQVYAAVESDTALATRVNAAWERVQALAALSAQQSAVLRGAGGAIGELTEQRNQVVKELSGIREALESFDTGHNELAGFVEGLEEMWSEETMYWYEDTFYDDAYETILSDVSETLTTALGGVESFASMKRTSNIMNFLRGERTLTEERIDLLRRLVESLEVDDEEDDEDSDIRDYEDTLDE